MHFSAGQDVTLKNYNVGTGVKSLYQVLIPASYQNRCEVLFFLEGETHASQIWPTLRKATPLLHFTKALKRPRNNAGPVRF